MTTENMIAAFLANGGEVRKVETGHRTTPEAPIRRRRERNPERETITIVTDHCGREFYRNEAGEWL